MENDKILAALESLDRRVASIEKSMGVINHELGWLKGNIRPSIVPTLIRYVIFPLIVVLGGLTGLKMLLPF